MTDHPDQRPRRSVYSGYDERSFVSPYTAQRARGTTAQPPSSTAQPPSAAARPPTHSATAWPPPVYRDIEAELPTSPGIPVIPQATRPPSTRLTAVVSFLFGPFGAAPASGAAHRAREISAPSGRYWGAFLLGWLAQLLVLSVVASVIYLNHGRPASTGQIEAPTTPSMSTHSPTPTPTPTPSPTPSPTPVAFPEGSTQCSDSVAVNSSTSCPFATNVESAFRASGTTSGAVEVSADSPVTHRNYTMSCTVATGSVTTCTGGNNAVVYLR